MPPEPEIVDDPQGKWIAECSGCGSSTDLESIGWVRRAAVSYGKRRVMKCPRCGHRSWCRILHVDRHGRPDQPAGYVFNKLVRVQAGIWKILLSGAAVVYAAVYLAKRLAS